MIEAKRNPFLANASVTVRITKERNVKKKEGFGYDVERMIEKYPVLLDIVFEASRIYSIKPVLCRMGKGQGKLIGDFAAYSQNDILIHAYIPKPRMYPLALLMEKQGLFNSTGLSVTYYYI